MQVREGVERVARRAPQRLQPASTLIDLINGRGASRYPLEALERPSSGWTASLGAALAALTSLTTALAPSLPTQG